MPRKKRDQVPLEWLYIDGSRLGPQWSAWKIGVKIDVTGPTPALRGLQLDPQTSGIESQISKSDLSRLPLLQLLAVAAGELTGDFHAWAAQVKPMKRPRGGSTAHLRAVASVYTTARQKAVRGGPRAAVAAHFETSLPTADRWIRQARVAGVLEPYDS